MDSGIMDVFGCRNDGRAVPPPKGWLGQAGTEWNTNNKRAIGQSGCVVMEKTMPQYSGSKPVLGHRCL